MTYKLYTMIKNLFYWNTFKKMFIKRDNKKINRVNKIENPTAGSLIRLKQWIFLFKPYMNMVCKIDKWKGRIQLKNEVRFIRLWSMFWSRPYNERVAHGHVRTDIYQLEAYI